MTENDDFDTRCFHHGRNNTCGCLERDGGQCIGTGCGHYITVHDAIQKAKAPAPVMSAFEDASRFTVPDEPTEPPRAAPAPACVHLRQVNYCRHYMVVCDVDNEICEHYSAAPAPVKTCGTCNAKDMHAFELYNAWRCPVTHKPVNDRTLACDQHAEQGAAPAPSVRRYTGTIDEIIQQSSAAPAPACVHETITHWDGKIIYGCNDDGICAEHGEFRCTPGEDCFTEKRAAPAPNTPSKHWNDFSNIKLPHVNVNGSTITFTIQDGPIKEVGENGCQIDALGEVWLAILQQFNTKFPCRENSITITHVEEALMWQQKRKADRLQRGVEGHDKL